jgi:predicted AlkP superfamily phosphohydrolase/phosphomutase
VQGREQHGIVARGAEYDRAVERVIAALNTLSTPDGRQMVDRVIRSTELTGGPFADNGPDLHVILDQYRYVSCPLFATDGHILSEQIRGDSGSHRLHGALIAAGPHIRHGVKPQNAHITDLAPTMLHLLGCPVPQDMDGRLLAEILAPGAQAKGATIDTLAGGYTSPEALSLSEQEEAELESRLQGLGYLG